MSHPDPLRPPTRLLDTTPTELSAEDAATAARLARLAAPPPDRVAQERVWRSVAIGLTVRHRKIQWVLLPAGAALSIALVAVGLRLRETAPAVALAPELAATARVALTAGKVLSAAPREGLGTAAAGAVLTEGSRLHTEDRAQTVAVLGDSQVLLSGGSDLGLESVGRSTFLRLSKGEVVCQVAPRKAGETFVVQTTRYRVTVKGTIFAVRERAEDDVDVSVSRGLVEVAGEGGQWLVPAGSAWHSRTPSAPATDDIAPEQRSLLEQASIASEGPRARISVGSASDGAGQLEISEGGVRLGIAPVTWEAPVGTYHFTGNVGATRVFGNVVTTTDTPTTVTLEAAPQAAPALPPAAVAPKANAAVAAKPVKPTRVAPSRDHRAKVSARSKAVATPTATAEPTLAPTAAPESKAAVEPAAPEQLARLDPQDARPAATLTPAPTPSAPAPAVAAPPMVLAKDPYAAAVGLARSGDPLAAAAALQTVVDARGAHADLALYELGRLRQQKLADPLGALQAYRAYEQQYPRGPLAQEVELSAIEIELQQEDLGGALSEIDRFLDAHDKSERAPEVHLLRGDVLRKRGNDQAALSEYRRAATKGAGDIAEEGLYREAACAERLGDTDGAGAALRDYLKRYPTGRHAKDAAAALKPTP